MRFKLLLLTLMVPMILFSYSWNYHFEQPVIKNNQILLNGCMPNQKAFEPAVPVKPVRLLLPWQQKAEAVKIVYSQPIIINGRFDINPVAPVGRLNVSPSSLPDLYSSCYQTDQFFPAKPETPRFTNQYKNGHSILTTILYPIQYNPVTKSLIYYQDIQLEIQTGMADQTLYKHNPSIVRSLVTLVDNPQLISTYPNTNRSLDDYDYLIITSNSYQNHFEDFIDFNLSRGLKTKLITKQTITDSVAGFDTQDKIRNTIRNEYINHSITYVLLAGDDEILPHRGFRTLINDYGTDFYDEPDMPADMYFSCLDGTWQVTGSQYFGESGSEDIFFEVYTSRFTIDSINELNYMKNKVISYSNTPVVDNVNNNLLVGEYLWGPPQFENQTYGQMYMDELVGHCTTNNYTTDGFNIEWSNNTLYDNTIPWDGSDLIESILNNQIFWVDHLGHSNVTYNMMLTNPDISSLTFTNNGTNSNYLLIYSQGCYSGSFDNRTTQGQILETDCIGEKFVTISTAAVAYVGNARYGLGSPYDTNGSGQVFHRYFHDALFGKNIFQIEKMNAYSKEVSAPFILEEDINLPPYYGQCKWIAYGLNIFSDPALTIWRSTPQTLSPVMSDTISITHDYTILTQPFTQISVHNSDKSFCFSAVTDSTGYINLSEFSFLNDYLSTHNSTMLTVNLKADGYYSYSRSVYCSTTGNTDPLQIPAAISLKIYPNPINANSQISFKTNQDGKTEINIYNIKGQKVSELTKQSYSKGEHDISLRKLSHLSSGVYFVVLKQNNQSVSKKMLWIK